MSGISSILKAGIDALPEKGAVKAESLPNLFKKMGVKNEELEYSGLELPLEGKYTKEDLLKWESGRQDRFGVVEVDSLEYKDYLPYSQRRNATYRERIYTFDSPKSPGYESEHFYDTENYLAHARTYETDIGGMRTHVVAEIQSDLHQQARRITELTEEERARVIRFAQTGEDPEGPVAIENIITSLGFYPDFMESSTDDFIEAFNNLTPPTGPWKDTWARKVLEREILEAYNIGAEQVAIPISGADLGGLARQGFPRKPGDASKSVQLWYEDYMPKMAQKVAKSMGAEFELVGDGGAALSLESVKEIANSGSASALTARYPGVFPSNLPAVARAFSDKPRPMDIAHFARAAEGNGVLAKLDFDHNSVELVKDLDRIMSIDNARNVVEQGIQTTDLGVISTALGIPINDPRFKKAALAWLDEREEALESVRNTLNSAVEQGNLSLDDVLEPYVKAAQQQDPETTKYAVIKLPGASADTSINPAVDRLIKAAQQGGDVGENLKSMLDGMLDTKEVTPEQHTKIVDALAEASDEADVARALETVKATQPKLPTFSMYASPAATAIVGYQMLREGYGQDEVYGLMQEQGFDDAELEQINSYISAVGTMEAEGYSMDEIAKALEGEDLNIQQVTEEPISDLPEQPVGPEFAEAMQAITSDSDMLMSELVAKMEVIYPTSNYAAQSITAFFGNREAQRAVDLAREAQRARIIQGAAARGVELHWNEEQSDWEIIGQDGVPEVVTPKLWQQVWEAKGELVLGFGAGIAGLRYGTRVGASAAAATPIPHPAVKGAVGLAVGGVTAIGVTAFGAVAGTELDYMYSAMQLQAEFEAEAMARKALDAAEMSVYGDAIAAGVLRSSKGLWKGAVKLKDFVKNNTTQRSMAAMKETFFVTDEEAAELVAKLQRVSDAPVETSDVNKAVAAVALTRPGGDALVAASVKLDPRASRAVVKAIDDRAKDVLLETNNLRGEDVGRFVRENLEGYRTMVKDNFEAVKVRAASAPGNATYHFDYEELALEPVLRRLGRNIENRDLQFKFLRQAERIRDTSTSRTYSDLLELRKLVNEFKGNSRIARRDDIEVLNEVLGKIDKEISKGAKHVLGKDADGWLTDWASANRQYSDMKRLEKNALAKVVTRPGVSDAVIAKALAKYSVALDDTFVQVIDKLPRNARPRVEGAVINELTEKFTAGVGSGMRATHFPMLADELNQINFTTPQARSLKRAIRELADVFKNDVALSQHAGGVSVPQFQSYLTVDPVVRLQYEAASTMFNYVRSLAPSGQGRGIALIRKTAEVLENPVNSKRIAELVELTKGEVDLAPQLSELAKQHTLKLATQPGAPRVKLYGYGSVLSTKGSGPTTSIPMHRIASTEDAKKVAEATGINIADRKLLDAALRDRGYKAVQLGAEKVRIISD